MTRQAEAGPSSPPSRHARPSNGAGPSSSSAASAFTYDPRQDASSRRAVRSSYRALIAHAEESKKDSTLRPSDLLELISQADALHEKVVAPSESILDTKTLTSMSEIGARMAKKMKLNADAFDTNEFISRLARFLGGEAGRVRNTAYATRSGVTDEDNEDDEDGTYDETTDNSGRRVPRNEIWDWDRLSSLAAKYSRRAPTIDFLLGPLEITPKTRKVVQRNRDRDEDNNQRAAPTQLRQQDLHRNAETDTAAQVRKVAELLAKQGSDGINLFQFVADPDSFTNTIENLFHVSFLVREGRAGITVSEDDGSAILAFTEPPGDEDYDSGVQKKQFVMEIDYPTYLEVIELYNIEQSIIPTRRNTVSSLGGRAALEEAAAERAARPHGTPTAGMNRAPTGVRSTPTNRNR